MACQNSAAKMNIYLFVFCRRLANDFSQMMRDSVSYAPLSLSRSLSFSVLYNHHSRIAQCSEPITESDFQFRTVNFSDFPQLLSQFIWLSSLIMTGKTLCELNEDSPFFWSCSIGDAAAAVFHNLLGASTRLHTTRPTKTKRHKALK